MIMIVALLAVAQTFHEHATLKGHTSVVSSIGFSPDSELLATGSSDGAIKIWGVADARERSTLRGHQNAILSAKFPAKGPSLTSMDDRGKMIFWDRIDGIYKSSKSQDFGFVGDIFDFDKQELGRLALVSSTKYNFDAANKINIPYWNLNILDVEDPKNVRSIKHGSNITALAFSPDGSLVSFGDGQGVIRVLSCSDRGDLVKVNSFTCPLDEEGSPEWPSALAFHPQNKFLAFSYSDTNIRLWKWADNSPYATLAGHSRSVKRIVISTDGTFAVSTASDMTIEIWSLKTLSVLQTIKNKYYITCVSISPDNQSISYGDYHGIARIWRVDR